MKFLLEFLFRNAYFYVSLKIALLLFDLDELILQSPQLAIDFLARVSNNVGLDRDFCNEFAQDSRWHLRQIHSSGHYSNKLDYAGFLFLLKQNY